MFKKILQKIDAWSGVIQTLLGSFIIASGWSWYHISRRPHSRFIFFVIATTLAVFIGYQIFKWLYHFITRAFNRHIFWQKQFGAFLDSLFFSFSLFFIVFFSNNQLLSLIIFFVLMLLFFYKTQTYLSHHPNAQQWKLVSRRIFSLIFFVFVLFSFFQYTAFSFANFDSSLKFHNIVLFRSWAMTMFLVLGFSVATLIYGKLKSPLRYLAVGLWLAFFVVLLVFWGVNISIMYFTGLYLSPLMIEVASGAGGVASNWVTIATVVGGMATMLVFIFIFRQILKSIHTNSFRQWVYYSLALIAVALGSLIGLSSFQNTPEYRVARNFYNYFLGDKTEATLSLEVREKLEKFGFFYNSNEFYLAHKEKVFTENKNLLSDKFKNTKPNIIIIFFESFSSRLTSVYNKDFPGLTPNLEQMAADSHTSIFKNFYNASTPTINGILAQLCSFLPPTGYTEIEVDKQLQRLRLLCLPTVLKENGGYKSATYITAVPKEFENKYNIFTSMDVDGIYGQDELAKIIPGEPLSWGYSDHQLFSVMWNMVQQKKEEPFLMMLSTVDTHAPYNLAQDMIPYKEGDNDVLNSFYTADHAFGQFWQQFKQSKYYDNTMVIVMADHAAFPGTDIKNLFPADADKLSFYDENMLMMYLPGVAPLGEVETGVPKEVDVYSSSIDITPTLLQILNINVPNSFEGHSIFDDKNKFPNVLGMHEYGLYINQDNQGARDMRYEIPSELQCKDENVSLNTSTLLTLCEYLEFYRWKRRMFEEGRFWRK